ncbi:MAG: lysostaphin resistance A-like protein [Candidatus Acidiferrales bacterium]
MPLDPSEEPVIAPDPTAFNQRTPQVPGRHAEPWSYRDLLLFLAFAIIALIVSNFVALTIYAALRPMTGWPVPAGLITSNTFFLLAAQLLFYAILFCYIYFLVVFRYHLRFWRGLRWTRLNHRSLARYIVLGILVTAAIQMVPTLLPDKIDFPLRRLFSSPASAYAIAAFAVLIAPFMEEIIFRGVLFAVFESRIGLRSAVVITAVLFAGLHVPEYWGAWEHVVLIFLVGLIFSLARGLTGSVTPGFVLHVTYNACLMIGLFVVSSHFRIIQSGLLR